MDLPDPGVEPGSPRVSRIAGGFFITFLPRSKCLLISWLQSPSAVILEHKKIKSAMLAKLCLCFLICYVGHSFYSKEQVKITASKITADGDCSHEIKRRLLLGRKVIKNSSAMLETPVRLLGWEDPLEKG